MQSTSKMWLAGLHTYQCLFTRAQAVCITISADHKCCRCQSRHALIVWPGNYVIVGINASSSALPGVVIGAAAAIILLTALLAFILWKRRRARAPESQPDDKVSSDVSQMLYHF